MGLGLLALLVVAPLAAAEARPAAAPPPRAPAVLGPQHDGRTFRLAPGREVALRLPTARRTWSGPRLSSNAVALAPVDYVAPTGFLEWTVTAVRPGRTLLSTVGRCAACAPVVRPLRVTLVVRAG